ncbi:MAG: minor capsid protein [Paenibacillus dendritiformis]|uniref:minor capsid protein n=1 Tax=uncultured Paenibacillus sp. TaxID=227322 RepID=UPI0025F71B90|nr:minor capsid protein [uncultured Paenibacillus sp.]MDU5143520.1 minor capsid protein [Paenibacillus dendritiformis]
MKVKAKVIINQGALKKLAEAEKRALEMTAEAVKSDIVTSAVVPKQTGELERSGHVDTSQLSQGKVKIVFDTPYARRLYWHPEYNFRSDKNANAQGKWMERYHAGDKRQFVRETYARLLKTAAKGLVK